jgi:hypothetical protein
VELRAGIENTRMSYLAEKQTAVLGVSSRTGKANARGKITRKYNHKD